MKELYCGAHESFHHIRWSPLPQRNARIVA